MSVSIRSPRRRGEKCDAIAFLKAFGFRVSKKRQGCDQQKREQASFHLEVLYARGAGTTGPFKPARNPRSSGGSRPVTPPGVWGHYAYP